MTYGDNPNDQLMRDAWHSFCDQVRAAGDKVFDDVGGASDGERTFAFRYLTQNVSQAFDMWLENRNTRYPNIHAFCSPIRGLGADNADCIYLQSWINDYDTYKISGTMGTARMFNLAVQGPHRGPLHDPFGDTPFANLFGEEIEADWDGNFTVWISPEPHEGNWIQSQPGTRKIYYRQYFDGWDEVPANYRIERIGCDDEPPPSITPVELVDSFQRAGRFVLECTTDWPHILFDIDRNWDFPNEFIRHGAVSNSENEEIDTRRGRLVQQIYWVIQPDEAVIVEFDVPDDYFWQYTGCNLFGGSLEYRYRQVNLTAGLTPRDNDGTTRFVMCHDDPGFANWIDLQGHTHGWGLFRNNLTRHTPELRTRLVKTADLEAELGDTSPRVTPDERRAEMRRRREANMRRFPYVT
jgi:hypothetical protein